MKLTLSISPNKTSSESSLNNDTIYCKFSYMLLRSIKLQHGDRTLHFLTRSWLNSWVLRLWELDDILTWWWLISIGTVHQGFGRGPPMRFLKRKPTIRREMRWHPSLPMSGSHFIPSRETGADFLFSLLGCSCPNVKVLLSTWFSSVISICRRFALIFVNIFSSCMLKDAEALNAVLSCLYKSEARYVGSLDH